MADRRDVRGGTKGELHAEETDKRRGAKEAIPKVERAGSSPATA